MTTNLGSTARPARAGSATVPNPAQPRDDSGRYAEWGLRKSDVTSAMRLLSQGVSADELDFEDPAVAGGLVAYAQRIASQGSAAARRSATEGDWYETDDQAQDALVALLTARSKGTNIENVGSMINASSRRALSKTMARRTSERTEDRKARRILMGVVEDLEHQLGRHLTVEEIADEAAKIREAWSETGRPREGFHVARRDTSMEAFAAVEDGSGSGDYGWVGSTPSAEDSYIEAEAAAQAEIEDDADTPVGRALDAVSSGDYALRDARKNIFAVLADHRNLPKPGPTYDADGGAHWVGHRAITAARGRLTNSAEVAAAAKAWLDEGEFASEENAARIQALFVVWPNASDRQRDDIAELLTDHPGNAHDLWDSALRLGSRPR